MNLIAKNKILSYMLTALMIVALLPVFTVPVQAARTTDGKWTVYYGSSSSSYSSANVTKLATAFSYVSSHNWVRIHNTGGNDEYDLGLSNPGFTIISGKTVLLTGNACTYYSGVNGQNLINLNSGGTLYVGAGITLTKENYYSAVASQGGTIYAAGTITKIDESRAANAYQKSTLYKLSGCNVTATTEGSGSWTSYDAYKLTLSNGTGVASSSASGGLSVPYGATGERWYTSGSTATVSATASTGYKITSGTGDYTMNQNRTANLTASLLTYAVSYNANGGSNAPSSQTKTHGTNLALSSSAPTFTGWTFMGWASSQAHADAGAVSYASGETYAGNAALSLFAVWKRTITLNNQDATSAGATSVTATYRAALPSGSISVPSKTGYTFGGYYTNTNGGGTKVYSNTGARVYSSAITDATTIPATLYAHWIANQNISGTVTIEYTYQQDGETIEVPKDGDSRATSAVIHLQRKISSDGNYFHVDTQNVSFNTSGDADTKGYSFANQPAIDANGNVYTYIVTVELSNYNTFYSGNDVTLTFNPNSFDAPFEITPTGNNPPPSINLKILYRDPGDTGSEGAIISQHINTYVTAILNGGKYTGSYPVWKYASGTTNPYTYQIVVLDGQGLANISYGEWIKWDSNTEKSSGTMTASFESKKQTVVKDSTQGDDFTVVTSSNNLDEIFDRIIKPVDMIGDNVVTLTLNIADIVDETDETKKIKAAAGNGSEIYFFDMTLEKTINGSSEVLSNVSAPVKVHISLDNELANKTYYRVYRYHDGVAEQILGDTSKTEHYVVDVDKSEIIIYTQKFSTYAIFGNDFVLDPDTGSDVDVQAKIIGEGGSVYKIDIAWGAMKFDYSTSGIWNPNTHEYETGDVVGWTGESFNNGNNKITAWNHSNSDVLVSFDVTENILSPDVTMAVNQDNEYPGSAATYMQLGKVPSERAAALSIDAYLRLDGTPNDLSPLQSGYTKIAIITVTIAPDGDELTPKN